MTLDDLPRLSDDDREALEDGYLALEGVPANDPEAAASPIYAHAASAVVQQISKINDIEIAGALDAIRQLINYECERDEGPSAAPLLECIKHKLTSAQDRIAALCEQSGVA